MSIPMAIVDFIPVFLFCASAILVQRRLYAEMSKGAFALLSGGTIMVFSAGFIKALWKLLYAANICDFARLNAAYFPMQSVGFLLAGIAMVAFLFFPQENKNTLRAAAAPAVFTGTAIFVIMMVLGCLGYCGGLALYARRHKKKTAAILSLVAFFLMLMMGYLSSKDFTQASMNWIAELVNTGAQLSLLLAARRLK